MTGQEGSLFFLLLQLSFNCTSCFFLSVIQPYVLEFLVADGVSSIHTAILWHTVMPASNVSAADFIAPPSQLKRLKDFLFFNSFF